jgi:hypothetical protein
VFDIDIDTSKTMFDYVLNSNDPKRKRKKTTNDSIDEYRRAETGVVALGAREARRPRRRLWRTKTWRRIGREREANDACVVRNWRSNDDKKKKNKTNKNKNKTTVRLGTRSKLTNDAMVALSCDIVVDVVDDGAALFAAF